MASGGLYSASAISTCGPHKTERLSKAVLHLKEKIPVIIKGVSVFNPAPNIGSLASLIFFRSTWNCPSKFGAIKADSREMARWAAGSLG